MELYEQRLLLTLVSKALSRRTRMKRSRFESLIDLVWEMRETLGLRLSASGRKDKESQIVDHFEIPPLKVLRVEIDRRIRQIVRCPPSMLERRVRAIAKLYQLDAIDRAILGIAYRYKRSDDFESVIDKLGRLPTMAIRELLVFSVALDLPISQISQRFRSNMPLRSAGLMEFTHDGFSVSAAALDALDLEESDGRQMLQRLIGPEVSSALSWDDFAHLGLDRARALSLLGSALKTRRKAVHVLLYGQSGTGKSEFARIIAARLKAPLHAVCESDRDGDELSRASRTSYFMMTQKLAGHGRPRLLVVEEAEDMLGGSPWSMLGSGVKTSGSKAYLNRMLETTGTPTIWTTNSIEWIDPAILRRMTYAIEVKAPHSEILSALWLKEAGRRGIDISKTQACDLAEKYEVAPGVVTGALNFVELTGGGAPDLEAGVAAITKAMRGGRPQAYRPDQPLGFDLGFLNADTDLTALTDKIEGTGKRAMSFCLYGPPGTGKTSFARHLATRLRLRLSQKRASDLISKWVGDTEKLIAEAFEESRDRGTMLMFDEADSLLQDRSRAFRGWEISQVNEMLTWMESHPLPFVCATNLMEGLDSAALRRFVFKIRFDWLTRQQARVAFSHFFDLEPPSALSDLVHLTPGDFSVVARKASILGVQSDAEALLSMLANEEALKPGAIKPIGFGIGQ